MTRPILASIDLPALRHNLDRARAAAGRARLLAVAKAAAYGHGLGRVLPALQGTDGIALLDLEDALLVRATGFRGRVVLLEGAFAATDLETAVRHHVQMVVHTPEQMEMIERATLPAPAGILLKVNTGMNRLGFRLEALGPVLARAERCPNVAEITLMTHFACADDGRDVGRQLSQFEVACAGSRHPRCLANSAALLRHPETRADWVRPGIMLYGASPFDDQSAAALGLRPVMTLQSRLVAVQQVRKGEAVGYGRAFEAGSDLPVGIVACGYADGYPRHAPTGTPVLVGGVRTRTVGRVSMDMLAVDLGPCPGAGVGTPVTLWGEGLPVEEVARAAGTVGYELLCALAPRVPVTVRELG